MLKVQHIPLSVGKSVNMAAQGKVLPFQKHLFIRALCPLYLAVMPSTSEQGNWNGHSIKLSRKARMETTQAAHLYKIFSNCWHNNM